MVHQIKVFGHARHGEIKASVWADDLRLSPKPCSPAHHVGRKIGLGQSIASAHVSNGAAAA
ncbi:hypothetical protein BSU04_33050 [Caballeronia sordidicola]|uniref:Uncharacterized protein n=1 Tax=Caballeronia sordidicola TaxID=196367 RepID=A0A226WSJ8_CABSO|nr:hypothetical protein BSU04_33050 [Caballeronia sordidicola]